jgi:LysR family glycine cleavage system transcriptional activator
MDARAEPLRRLPPLNALRAFEAAARLQSFARAGEELHVTPAAVSHQVKALEEQLGVRLFKRLPNGLQLTRAGRFCLPKLREGFDLLAEAVGRLRRDPAPGSLSVEAAPTFAAKWLAPRLHRFVAAHSHVDVQILASTRLIDASADAGEPEPLDGDVAIRFGSGNYPEFRVAKLLEVSVTPMCGARALEGARPLREPADLRDHVLIHDNIGSDDGRPLWQVWLEGAGVKDADVTHGLRFNHAVLALEAAADGLGVALGMPEVAAFDVASGRLVAPFEFRLPLSAAYYVATPADRRDRPEVSAFRDWALEEARKG